MIHAKMTKPRKVAPKATKKDPPKAAAPKTAPTAKTFLKDLSGTTTGRTSCAQPNISNPPRSVGTPAMPPVGSVIEVLIDGQWWPGTIFVSSGLARVDLFVGAPAKTAVIYRGGLNVTWRLANRLHSVPLTRQGVRNLDMAAPPRFRNGRRFRKPKHFEAICSHPEEALAEEPIEEEVEGLDENRQLFTYTLRFLECGDCGAEISI